MFFFDDSEKTLRELLEALSKGIDLLANDNLNADLYYAYEKYVISTIKLVDGAYWKNYAVRFEEKNPFDAYTVGALPPYFQPRMPIQSPTFPSYTQASLCAGSSVAQQLGFNPPPINYKEKLKVLLQKITTVVKEITSE